MEKEISFQNNGKLKLFIIVGTRPEIIRLSEVIKKCRVYFDTVLVHTGQNYDYNLNGIFFRDLGLAAPEVSRGNHGEHYCAVIPPDGGDAAGCGAGAWRYEFLPFCDWCEAPAHPDFPYGSWKPMQG